MVGAGVDRYCEGLVETWWQSLRRLLELMGEAELFEATRLAASCFAARELGVKRLAVVEKCRAKLTRLDAYLLRAVTSNR